MASFTFPWDVNSTCKHEWQSHRWVHDQGLKPFSPVGFMYLIRSMATSLPISFLDESFSNRITPQIKDDQVSKRGHWTGSVRRTITCTHFSLQAPLADLDVPCPVSFPQIISWVTLRNCHCFSMKCSISWFYPGPESSNLFLLMETHSQLTVAYKLIYGFIIILVKIQTGISNFFCRGWEVDVLILKFIA